MMKRRINVCALIDWKSQAHNSGILDGVTALNASKILRLTTGAIAGCLKSQDNNAKFSVSMRLYHGWMKGWEIQPIRKHLTTVIAGLDFSTLSTSSDIVFQQGLAFGDTLVNACEQRLIGHMGVHLGNTLRRTPITDELREKMVDTALAADLLSLARISNGDWLLVVAEDDDHVPPVFVAERWLESSTGRVMMLRKRTTTTQFLNLDGLVLKGKWR